MIKSTTNICPTKQYGMALPTRNKTPFAQSCLCHLLFLLFVAFVQSTPQVRQPCQTPNRQSCVCDLQSILEEFDKALQYKAQNLRTRYPNYVDNMMRSFNCSNKSQLQLPPYLKIELEKGDQNPKRMSFRRRYRTKREVVTEVYPTTLLRKKRQNFWGSPKEEALQKALENLPQQANHYYKGLGSRAELKCNGDSEVVDDLFGTSSKYSWIHRNGNPISAPKVSYNKETGELIFPEVRLADSDIYNCTVTIMGDNGAEAEVQTFLNQLDVVATQSLWRRFGVTYSTPDKCKHKELLEIQRKIPTWVQNYVCDFCQIRNVSVKCLKNADATPEGYSFYVQISLALSAMGFEQLSPAWLQHSEFCLPPPGLCLNYTHDKILTIVGSSLRKLFNLRIQGHSGEEILFIYNPVLGSIHTDVIHTCPAGFFYTYSLCFPCAPGKFSSDETSFCLPCEKGFYQPNPGSSACFPCPRRHSTLAEGSLSQMDCLTDAAVASLGFAKGHWILAGLIGLLLLLIILVLVTLCCYPQSKLGRCLRCVWCCGGASSEDDESQMKLIEDNDEEADETEIRVHTEEKIFNGKSSKRGNRRSQDHDNVKIKEETRNLVYSSRDLDHTQRNDNDINQLSDSPADGSSNEDRIEYYDNINENKEVRDVYLKPLRNNDVPPQTPRFPRPWHRSRRTKYVYRNEKCNPDTERKSRSKKSPNYPSLKLGNVLKNSKSLVKKLAEQRAKLGERLSKSRSRSRSRQPNKSGFSLKRFRSKTRFKLDNNANQPCTDCKSDYFTGARVKDRVKSFQ